MKKILMALLSVASIAPVFAGSTYIDGNFGAFSAPSTYYSTSFGFNANVGYQFNPYFGLEGGFTYSPLSVANSTFSNNVNANYYSVDVAAKGLLPLSREFSLYGKAGLSENWYSTTISAGGLSASGTGDSAGAIFGLGAQFNISRNWSLHLEDDYTVLFNADGVSNPNIAMIGFGYKF